jgi:hypothetical protein
MGKVLSFIIGIIVGIVLVIGGTVGAGYYVLTRKGGVGKAEDLAAKYVGKDFGFTPETRNMSILDFYKKVSGAFSGDKTVGELEDAIGSNVITSTLHNKLGVDPAVSRGWTFKGIPEGLTNTITLNTVKDKLKLELPEFPIFKDEEFLNTPIKTAFADLDERELDKFLEVTYDGDPDITPEHPASSKLLQKLGVKKLNELSSGADQIVKDMHVSDFMTVPASNRILQYLDTFTIEHLGEAVDEMKVSDAIDVADPNCNKVIVNLGDYKVKEIGVHIGDALAVTTFGEALNLPATGNHPILQYLGGVHISSSEINAALTQMTVKDAFENTNGVLSLIDEDTLLSALPQALGLAVSGRSLYVLERVGIYSLGLGSSTYLVKDSTYNLTPAEMAHNYALIAQDPLSAGIYTTPASYDFYDATLSPAELETLGATGAEKGDVIFVHQDVTIPADTVFSFPFVIIVEAGYTLTIEPGVSIQDDNGGYMYIGGAYSGAIASVSAIQYKTPGGAPFDAVLIEYGA